MSGASTGSTFLDQKRLAEGGPRRFVLAVERLLWHLGFDDIRNIDGPGDEGGDLLALREGYRWVVQCKWKKNGVVPQSAVREVDAAKAFYQADRAVVATNRVPGVKAIGLRDKLLGVGVRIDFWKDDTLAKFANQVIPEYVPSRFEPYPYQAEAIAKAKKALEATNQALVIMATGLGKTVVGGEVVDWQLKREPENDVLVVAHVKELVRQLERAMWRHLPKHVPTQTLTGDDRPPSLSGVTCATVQSAL
jgi:predicted helicase